MSVHSIREGVVKVLNVFYKPFNSTVTWIKDYQRNKALAKISQEYHTAFMQQEMTPISKCDTTPLLDRTKVVIDDLRSKQDEKSQEIMRRLQRNVLAQKLRSSQSQGTFDQEKYNKLEEFASKWKQSKTFFINRNLAERDKTKLREAFNYEGFADVLLSDPECREDFFWWVILNDSNINPFQPNDVGVFAKFPALHSEILSNMGFRCARFGGDLFQVDSSDQVVTMPLEGKRVKVINDEKHVMIGHLEVGKLTVDFPRIFKELNSKASYDGVGEFEICNREGVWLWNAKFLGFYNEDLKKLVQIDLSRDDWIKDLPWEEKLSYTEAENRYHVKMENKPDGVEGSLDEAQYPLPERTHPLLNIAATQKTEYDFLGTHAYNRFLLVNRKEQQVELKSMGNFMYPFPLGAWQLLKTLTRYSPSYMYSPDENNYNANRQHAGDYEVPPVIVRPSPLEWLNYTRSLKRDILNGWKGKLGFNFIDLQCTTRLWLNMREHFGSGRIPDLRVKFWKLQPTGAVKGLYSFLQSVSQRVAVLVLFFLGSWRSMKVVNKYGEDESASFFWKQRPFKWVVHPGALFKPTPSSMAYQVR